LKGVPFQLAGRSARWSTIPSSSTAASPGDGGVTTGLGDDGDEATGLRDEGDGLLQPASRPTLSPAAQTRTTLLFHMMRMLSVANATHELRASGRHPCPDHLLQPRPLAPKVPPASVRLARLSSENRRRTSATPPVNAQLVGSPSQQLIERAQHAPGWQRRTPRTRWSCWPKPRSIRTIFKRRGAVYAGGRPRAAHART
jgi:hypothetical protein